MTENQGIYVIRNNVTGKTYVGSSRDCLRRKGEHYSRLRRGAHLNGKLQASWNKHGEASFDFTVIMSVLNPDHLEAIEQSFLDDMKAVKDGYNLAPIAGNTAGWKASDETRKRMSDAAKKRDNSLQVKAMQAATTGVKRPQYVIDAMQAARKANPISAEGRARMSASAKARGSNITPEHQILLRSLAIARARFSAEQMADMAGLKDAGWTLKKIGEKFGITAESSVSLLVKKARAARSSNDN